MELKAPVIPHIVIETWEGVSETAVDLMTADNFVCLFVIIFPQVVYLHTE